MSRRVGESLLWVMVGAIATIGGFWVVVRSLLLAHVGGAWLPYAAHVAGAAAAGAAMVACAPLRPTREPLLAGLVAIAILAALFVAPAHPGFSWMAARSAHPWLIVLAVTALSGASAVGGAWLGRALTSTLALRRSVAALAGLVVMGAMVVTASTFTAITGGFAYSGTGLVLVVVVACLVAGFVVQGALSVRRPWTCAAGVVVLVLWTVLARGSAELASSLVAGAGATVMLAPVMYLGARLGWRLLARHRAEAQAIGDLPAARLR